MPPRILDLDRCKHCKAELPHPTPRVCPTCGGSLQRRHLAIGCLTSAPPPLIAGWLLVCLASPRACTGPRAPEAELAARSEAEGRAPRSAPAAPRAPRAAEPIAFGTRRP
jgi:hypothetical protein